VLFINADAEFREGRAQNYLEPEHIEKIVNAFERFEDIPSFAAVVTHEKLKANDFNLNIRRYADNAPPPEPHDVRAHLLGGVPKAEVQAHSALFKAHGFDPMRVLVGRDERYFDLATDLKSRVDIKRRIEADKGVKTQEARLTAAFESWWAAHHGRLAKLPDTQDLMAVRTDLLASFVKTLEPVGLLDRFKVAGVVARWWGGVQFDLKTLVARGFEGVIEGWVTTITTGLEDEGNKDHPLDHKLVKQLLPEFLEEIAEAEGRVVELEGKIKAAQPSEDENGEGDNEEGLSEDELQALKKDLTAAKKKLKALKASLIQRLQKAQAGLNAEAAQQVVLGILKADLDGELSRCVTAHRLGVVSVVEGWWDKYRVTLREIEVGRDAARDQLGQFLQELGYAD
jgi:type I restriction enzyme M protein